MRTGRGDVLVPAWGGAAAGVEYEAGANRLWVAGGPTGTVRVYDATTRELLRQYTFSPAGFLNDLVVTHDAVYVTDSNNAWLDVIPLGPHGGLPATGRHDAAAERDRLRDRPVQRERHRRGAWLAIVVDSFTGGLFRVDPRPGSRRRSPPAASSVANGDGLELRGSTLFVVRNANDRAGASKSSGWVRLTSARPRPNSPRRT